MVLTMVLVMQMMNMLEYSTDIDDDVSDAGSDDFDVGSADCEHNDVGTG